MTALIMWTTEKNVWQAYSCIDANGELVDADTYEECVSGGMCLTTLVSKGVGYNGLGDSFVDSNVDTDIKGEQIVVKGEIYLGCDDNFDNNDPSDPTPDGKCDDGSSVACDDADDDLVCDVDGDADKPSRYDRTPDGVVDNHVLSDGRMPDYFLRAGSDGVYIRDRGICCQDGGLEDQNHPP